MQRFAKFQANAGLYSFLTSTSAIIADLDPTQQKSESYRKQAAIEIKTVGRVLKPLAKDMSPDDFRSIADEFSGTINNKLGDFDKRGAIHKNLGDLQVELGKLANPGANGTGRDKDQRPTERQPGPSLQT